MENLAREFYNFHGLAINYPIDVLEDHLTEAAVVFAAKTPDIFHTTPRSSWLK